MDAIIYKIQSISDPLKMYIGSTSYSLEERQRSHLFLLRKNKHHSGRLQRHYNQFGESDLYFMELYKFPYYESDILDEEQLWILILEPYFNINLIISRSFIESHSNEYLINH